MIPLAVNEIFGPTYQGEGRSLGKRAIFLRLTGCNLACDWCDTPFTWKWTEWSKAEQTHLMQPDEVLDKLFTLADDTSDDLILVISGGEPLLQQKGIVQLLDAWEGPIEIESNGTVVPCEALDIRRVQFNFSPKLSSSGNEPRPYRALEPSLRPIWARTTYKFVCSTLEDLEEVEVIEDQYRLDRRRILIMPEGITPDSINTHAAAIADAALAKGYNMTTRLHVLLWGNERAR